MITVRKTVLSNATPEQVRAKTEELARGLGPGQHAVAAARLGGLAAELAAHPDLRVSVITYQDGTQELQVLHTGPPQHDPDAIDCWKFAGSYSARTLSLAGESGIRDVVTIIRGILLNASAH